MSLRRVVYSPPRLPGRSTTTAQASVARSRRTRSGSIRASVVGRPEYIPATYFNKTQHYAVYTPDLDQPAFTDIRQRDHSVRLTWQVSAKHKIAFTEAFQDNCFCRYTLTSAQSPEASNTLVYDPLRLTQATWSYPATNRLLFDVGVTHMLNTKDIPYYDGATKDDIAITDSGLGLTYNAANNGLGNTGYTPFKPDTGSQMNGRATMSYVTGSHAFKTGLQFYQGWDHRDAYVETGVCLRSDSGCRPA